MPEVFCQSPTLDQTQPQHHMSNPAVKEADDGSFKKILAKAQEKYLRPAVYLLVIGLSIYPLIPDARYKFVALFMLGMAIVRVIFEVEKTILARIKSNEDRLADLSSCISRPEPKEYPDFTAAQGDLLADINEIFAAGEPVRLDIIGVSARYSWRMVEDNMGKILSKNPNAKLHVDVAVSTRDLLMSWELGPWADDLDRTLTGIDRFKEHQKEAVDGKRLVIRQFSVDNIPSWHGVLINNRTLYIGSTAWEFHDDTHDEFKVGQCAYRRFVPNDVYGGSPRIRVFENWLEKMRRRHRKLSKTTQ